MSVVLGFRHLLGGILVTYVLAIALSGQLIGAPARVAVIGGVLLLAVRSRRKAGELGLPALILATVLFVATLAAAVFTTGKTLTIVAESATIVLVAAAMTVLASTLLRLGEVNRTTVDGVLCIYLLLALLFGSINDLGATIVPAFLHGISTPALPSETLYYSVITLTTVGYGDITPATNVARAVSATEALIGQLYLVSVVAAVVARYPGRQRDR
jgi:hypothetical protein